MSEPLEIQLACELLGVSSRASSRDIKAAYRRKALAKHPDRGGASMSFVSYRNHLIGFRNGSGGIHRWVMRSMMHSPDSIESGQDPGV